MSVVGIKECAEALAVKRGIAKSEAGDIIKDVVAVISEQLVSNGGVSFKGQFTIKTKQIKGREGSVAGKPYKTEDSVGIKIELGSNLKEELNK